jgi:xylose isomerase
MRNYLLLKERAASFRADPEVQIALAAAKVYELDQPTLSQNESVESLRSDRSTWEDFNCDAYFNGMGFGFIRLQQLATEHLLGTC